MLKLVWETIKVNIRLNTFHPLGFAALIVLVLWAISVPSIGVNKADFLARTLELGYPPLSDAQLAGLGVAQVASSFMSLCGVLLFLNNLDRERMIGLDELYASLPISDSVFVVLQYVANVVTLLAFSTVAYAAALAAYSFRGFDTFSWGAFLWPGFLFPLGSSFLLASLPLLLDALHLVHIVRGIAYGVVVVGFNLGPFSLAAMTNLDHPLHPLFQVWFTANLGLDTFGVWYLRGYLDLVLEVIEQLGTPVIPPDLYWGMVVRPRLAAALLGVILAAFAVVRARPWRFRRSGVDSL
jgi:hypothetical protein